MAEILNFRFHLTRSIESWADRPESISVITSERIEIFWLLDQILKALIEADRMVPLLRVYDVVLNFRFSTKKNVPKKRTYPMYVVFFGRIFVANHTGLF